MRAMLGVVLKRDRFIRRAIMPCANTVRIIQLQTMIRREVQTKAGYRRNERMCIGYDRR
jgi:hypothetical protein